MKRENTPIARFAGILREYGFIVILCLVVLGFSLSTQRFLSVTNILGLFHASAPLMIMAAGLALIVMTGNLDISIGSISFFSSAIGAVLMARSGLSPVLALPLVVGTGAVCGLLNGLVFVYLKVNPLITTMGSMFVFRGLALQITGSRVISIDEGLRAFGNFRIGPVYLDILIGIAFLFVVHLVHTRTPFGRHIMAIGNNKETAGRLGIRVKAVTLAAFVLSGFCAGLGGLFMVFQIGAVTLQMGVGMEFTAIAAIVIGGISLFGGEGAILPNFVLGALTLGIIENGLNHVGASPYLYPFVRGGIILAAMYADSLKRGTRPRAIPARIPRQTQGDRKHG